ncbi:MAG: GlsB/YeaQ/YmgE family stress response membrane protein [Thermoleophilia bacterium]|nr:GlsB/YeaQ/YmgE family stress response membrane protein [Thermoleophilia bacterium]
MALKLLWWALVGLVIGWLAKFLVPAYRPVGWLATILYGIGGALLGGVVADAIGVGGLVQFLLAIAAAAVLIVVVGGARR